ncbi:acetoin utilization protein [Defluviimonas sp. 20V17]|uniref:Acetoin utilization deacetylase AcuC n=1 Tax=Allgaiera indica TaxID=765699 RepID=A0AAN4UR42_9RHOB|nr:histone deacetylase family protein [Allgaiera indica]KDB02573.1 acetoin utilization protein [Defluviimonas sp. 20V17]GHE01623.1 acetoin utilization protein [Allgaiera indica]SDW97848.1 Acetoin utilization deacetylase AcuC [Allgaiera indica]
MTIIYMHDDCLGHVEPAGHPEQHARLKSVAAALEGFAGLDRRTAPLGARAEIARCHPESYIDRVHGAVPVQGWSQLDADTYLAPGSWAAALRGVGGVCAAVDAVLGDEDRNAFVACRPPGHHAERETAMGFCLFGNAAIAAKRALDHHGLSRVAVVDFDVHHGNGTQDLLWNEARTLFCSSHQMPLYPGTGAANERGAHDNVLNLPLAPGSDGAEMRRAYQRVILPAVDAFKPELIVISAGFDAHAADPLAQLEWRAEDFGWLTAEICALAEAHCGGRVVSTLEGGYDLQALGESSARHVRELMERSG